MPALLLLQVTIGLFLCTLEDGHGPPKPAAPLQALLSSTALALETAATLPPQTSSETLYRMLR